MDKTLKEIKPVHLYTTTVTLFLLAVLVSFIRIGELYTSLSDFGADNRTSLIFNFLIFLSGIVGVIASVQFCKENLKKFGRARSILLIASTASLSFIGIFPSGLNQYVTGVHHVFTFIIFVGMPLAMILFGTLFYRKLQNIFLVLIFMGILDFLQLLIFYNSNQVQVWQWLGILFTITFHFVLLKYTPSLSEIKDEFEELL